MAFKLFSDVRETSTTGGTGNQILNGAFDASYNAFGSRHANGDAFFYCMKLGSAREIGLGSYNAGANSISRIQVYKSTNNNNLVNFGSGTVDIFVTNIAPSDLDAAGLALMRGIMGMPWEPISSVSAAGATVASIALPSSYSQFKLVVQNINPSAAATLYCQLSPNGGTSFDGGLMDYNYQLTKHAGSSVTTSNADSNIIVFASSVAASARGQIEITIDPGSGSQFPNMFWEAAFLDSATNKVDRIEGAGMRSTTGRYNALNFITNAGTFVTCDAYLLGRR